MDEIDEQLDREDRILRGARIERLLADEDIKEAFAYAEVQCVEDWRRGETLEAREEAWAGLNALKKLRERLQQNVADGQYAQAEVDALEKRKQR